MSTFVLTDATAWVAGYDFTADTSEMSLSMEVDEQENTTFGGGGWRSKLGGLKNVAVDLSGYWQSDTTAAVDPQAFSDLGNIDRAVTISPTGAAGSTAYFMQMGKFSYELGGGVGEVAPFSLSMQGTNGIGAVRGQVAKAKGNVSATGATGSVLDLGDPDGLHVYAALHVFSPGTTVTIELESDDDVGFADPTTQATIGPLTTAGGTWMTRLDGAAVAGETHWRFNVTTCTGTFSIAGAIAVQ